MCIYGSPCLSWNIPPSSTTRQVLSQMSLIPTLPSYTESQARHITFGVTEHTRQIVGFGLKKDKEWSQNLESMRPSLPSIIYLNHLDGDSLLLPPTQGALHEVNSSQPALRSTTRTTRRRTQHSLPEDCAPQRRKRETSTTRGL